MKVMIVDDDPQELQTQTSLLDDICREYDVDVELVGTYSDGESFLQDWKNGRCDLIILDIMMGQMSGIEVARQIRSRDKNVRLIFCSSTNEYAGESYLVDASYYLQKPVGRDQIENMLRRLKMENVELYRSILLPNGRKIPTRAIAYIEFEQHQAQIHMTNQGEIECWLSQKDLEKQLQAARYFAKIRQGTIINLYEIAVIDKDLVTMKDGTLFHIAANKVKMIEEMYTDFLFHTARKASVLK